MNMTGIGVSMPGASQLTVAVDLRYYAAAQATFTGS